MEESSSPKPGHAVRAPAGESSEPSKGGEGKGGSSGRKGELEKNNSRSILRLPVHLRGIAQHPDASRRFYRRAACGARRVATAADDCDAHRPQNDGDADRERSCGHGCVC